tara:strand:- start:7827 stop:7994 length:168 start_codon:yes stop_codon:yes gene_type:complete
LKQHHTTTNGNPETPNVMLQNIDLRIVNERPNLYKKAQQKPCFNTAYYFIENKLS